MRQSVFILIWSISYCCEKIYVLDWFKDADELFYCFPYFVACLHISGFEKCFEFAESHLDVVEVGAVGRKEKQFGIHRFDGFSYLRSRAIG